MSPGGGGALDPHGLIERLEPLDLRGRLGRVRHALAALECDGMVVTSRSNVRYLTGFSGSAGALVIRPGAAVLVTDGRYRQQATEQVARAQAPVEVLVASSGPRSLAQQIAGVSMLAVESEHISWARQRALAEEASGIEMVPTSGLVEGLRRVKDGAELARIEAAAAVADRALSDVVGLLSRGVSEIELANDLDHRMRALGATGSAFETIVAAGPNAAMPHARPTPRRVERGELVVIDFGAVVDGYCSDMTRTFCAGQPATATAEKVVAVVAESQRAGVASVRAGVETSSVDRACREVIGAAGWGDAFVHGTGHGVGLDVHEAPGIAAGSPGRLEAGSVVTVEPGVYLPGVTGARIEDTVVVTADGCRAVTTFAKDLIV